MWECHKHMHKMADREECPGCVRDRPAPVTARRLNDATPGEWTAASAAHYAARTVASKVALATDQPEPKVNSLPAAWDLVMADMRNRDQFGEAKYGVRLQPHNGRDFLADAYQEALDLAVYLRGAIYERDAK